MISDRKKKNKYLLFSSEISKKYLFDMCKPKTHFIINLVENEVYLNWLKIVENCWEPP